MEELSGVFSSAEVGVCSAYDIISSTYIHVCVLSQSLHEICSVANTVQKMMPTLDLTASGTICIQVPPTLCSVATKSLRLHRRSAMIPRVCHGRSSCCVCNALASPMSKTSSFVVVQQYRSYVFGLVYIYPEHLWQIRSLPRQLRRCYTYVDDAIQQHQVAVFCCNNNIEERLVIP